MRTAIGIEDGYVLAVAEFAALHCLKPRLHVHVFDLGYEDIDGLLGLTFLRELNYEVRSAERRILVEAIESGLGEIIAIDAELWLHFGSAEAVNDALRLMIAERNEAAAGS